MMTLSEYCTMQERIVKLECALVEMATDAVRIVKYPNLAEDLALRIFDKALDTVKGDQI